MKTLIILSTILLTTNAFAFDDDYNPSPFGYSPHHEETLGEQFVHTLQDNRNHEALHDSAPTHDYFNNYGNTGSHEVADQLYGIRHDNFRAEHPQVGSPFYGIINNGHHR